MNEESSLSELADKFPFSEKQLNATQSFVTDATGEWTTAAIYEVLSRSDRREHGIFFSGKDWARILVSQVDTGRWSRFIDPSVGNGDLLVEVCLALPLGESPVQTLEQWSARLAAIDLRLSFLRIAWNRVQSIAFQRHGQKLPEGHSMALPKSFKHGDALQIDLELRPGDCLLMNPPYQRVQLPVNSELGRGKRSAAALHLERMLKISPVGVGVVALVPDVMRSGTLYSEFRKALRSHVDLKRFAAFGNFGAHADVDVAVIVGITSDGSLPKAEVDPGDCHRVTVGDFFEVSVGPVVPHRNPETGRTLPYLTPHNSPAWEEMERPSERAKFAATAKRGPLVLVRRTSSPSDRERARATIVNYGGEMLVENHLLICTPKDGKIDTCRRLARSLSDPRTSAWLNEQIRCRHLTVASVSRLPWFDGHLKDYLHEFDK